MNPPLNTRFNLLPLYNHTALCIVRRHSNYYTFEWRDPDGKWWRLMQSDMSAAAARATLKRMAARDPNTWTHLMVPSPLETTDTPSR
jgi:hypothetical protein